MLENWVLNALTWLFSNITEVPALQNIKPTTCEYVFEDQDNLHNFFLHVKPTEGPWRDGVFKFEISVPDDYNMKVIWNIFSMTDFI